MMCYRGRLAPSPTGLLHLGHARTFWIAYLRARNAGGTLVLRNEDLDPQRSRPEFTAAMRRDLAWLGIRWQEGPDASTGEDGGLFAPYAQSLRSRHYRAALRRLLAGGHLYPCVCSRRELAQSAQAPHEGADAEPLYPGTCRREMSPQEIASALERLDSEQRVPTANWRFRTPAGRAVEFRDNNPSYGTQRFTAGEDFSDFILWRRDDVPAYQLACVVDDAAMQITEVVRGADLLLSTARQILLFEAMSQRPPEYFHCGLLADERGQRLAKRHDALSIRHLRESGLTPQQVLRQAFAPHAPPE